jgi:hypothetical protein
LYTSSRGKRSIGAKQIEEYGVSLKSQPTQGDNHIPGNVTSVDRLYGHFAIPFGDHDSQIAFTPWAGAAHIFCHSVLSLGQAFVHHDLRNLQPEPFRKFFHTDGEPLKLKARDSYD